MNGYVASETEKAYLAGLIDGEGHIGITGARYRDTSKHQEMRTQSLIVTVASTYIPLLRMLHERWGGSLVTRKQPKQRLLIGNLRWSHAAAAFVLEQIREYMIIKRAQADLAIIFAEGASDKAYHAQALTREEWDRREELRIAIREINRPGQDLTPSPYPENEPRTCVYCGEQFSNYRTRKAIYCSNTCKSRDYWQKRRAKIFAATGKWPATAVSQQMARTTQTCEWCKNEFAANRKRKYCSDLCRNRQKRLFSMERNTKECPACGKTFPAQPNQAYCSRKCWLTVGFSKVDLSGNGAIHRAKTNCPQGHPYNEANTRIEMTPRGTLGRKCRVCDAERHKADRTAIRDRLAAMAVTPSSLESDKEITE